MLGVAKPAPQGSAWQRWVKESLLPRPPAARKSTWGGGCEGEEAEAGRQGLTGVSPGWAGEMSGGQPVTVGSQKGLPQGRAPPPSTREGSLTLLMAWPAPESEAEPGDRAHPTQIQDTPRPSPSHLPQPRPPWAQALRPQRIQGGWLEGQDGAGPGDRAVQSGLFSRPGSPAPPLQKAVSRWTAHPLGKHHKSN